MRRPLLVVVTLVACAAPAPPAARVVPPVDAAVADEPRTEAEAPDPRRLELEARLLEADDQALAGLGIVLAGEPLGLDVLDGPQERSLAALAERPLHGQRRAGERLVLLRAGAGGSFWFRCPGGAVGLTIGEVSLLRGAAGFEVGLTRWLLGPGGIDLSASRRLELADGATAVLRLGPEGPGRLVLLTARLLDDE